LTDEHALQKVLSNHDLSFLQKRQIVEVDSAFGGLALYKRSSIEANPQRYCGQQSKFILNGETSNFFRMQRCEHVDFNVGFKALGQKIVVHPELINRQTPQELRLNPSAFRTMVF